MYAWPINIPGIDETKIDNQEPIKEEIKKPKEEQPVEKQGYENRVNDALLGIMGPKEE